MFDVNIAMMVLRIIDGKLHYHQPSGSGRTCDINTSQSEKCFSDCYSLIPPLTQIGNERAVLALCLSAW